MNAPIHIGFFIYPGVTQLDATGPAQVLSRVPGAVIHMIWKSKQPVATDAGFAIAPTDSFASCPELDVLCVPGGGGQAELMTDDDVLGFLRHQGNGAKYVTSVCTGSLLLGAAGLLEGYEAACHWAWRDLLTMFGAKPKAARVVRDRNRISGGGVTAGIDFALTLAAELADEETARLIQLSIEYDPAPPFSCGSPEGAGPDRVARFRREIQPQYERRRSLVEEAAARAAS
ncbi:MAG TPA: DJ-1/PfpI family protein [Polyangiaceae bacterium]|jgi:cyclohexyl-isocyanide hydratase|nr:DJ-1/PfpI family protein [Polyangiaceae bacterium]